MQASDISQNFIINTTINELKYYQNVLDLYSGIGTYSFPLSEFCNIHSFENNTNMVENMNFNIHRLNIKNIKAEVRDLDKKPLNVEEFNNSDAIIIIL